MPFGIDNSTPGIKYNQKKHIKQKGFFDNNGFNEFNNNPSNYYKPQKHYGVYFIFINRIMNFMININHVD